MNKRDAAKLAFKLLGLFFGLGVIRWIEQIGSNWWSIASAYTNSPHSFWGVSNVLFPLLSLVLVVGTGVFIWQKSEMLADRVFPPSQPSERLPSSDAAVRRQDVLRLALAIIGIWLMANSLPGIISTGIARFLPNSGLPDSMHDYGDYYARQEVVGLIREGIEFLLGALLLFWQPVSTFAVRALGPVRGVLFFENQAPEPLPVQEISNRVVCPYCKNPVEGATAVCPKCGTLYHEACWNEHGACAVFGCDNPDHT
jgi:hypothetical protein